MKNNRVILQECTKKSLQRLEIELSIEQAVFIGKMETLRKETKAEIKDLRDKWKFQTNENYKAFLDLYGINPLSITCFDCSDFWKCPYSLDPWNTDGDCLAIIRK